MSLSDLIHRQKTIEAYIKEDSELARKLLDAGDNIELRRQALHEKQLDSFLTNIIDDDNYVDFVDELVKSIINKFPEEEQKKQEDDLGVKPGRVRQEKKKSKKPKKPGVKKTIKQKGRSGKTYKRSYKVWQSSEKQFIKVRIKNGLSASKTRKEFITYFGADSKTKSSVNTQFYRLKNKGDD